MRALTMLLAAFAICAEAKASGDFAVAPGTVSIEALFEQSALVCNCYVTGIEDHTEKIEVRGKPSLRHYVIASVRIQDSYKVDESLPSSFSLRYVVDEQQGVRVAGSRLTLVKGETAILFLKEGADHTFEFADPFVGAVQFASLPDKLGDTGILKLQAALNAVARQGTRDQLAALQMLLGFRHIADETRAEVLPLSNSPDANIALTAIGILLRTKTMDSLQRLESYLASHRIDIEPISLYVIGPEVSEFRNPDALPTLEILGQSKYRSIRSGAMDAIRGIKSTKSIPYLMTKLSDPDQDAQYVALITLSEILSKSDGDYAPSMYLFDKKPQYYISLWKDWWVEEGSKLYPPAPSSM